MNETHPENATPVVPLPDSTPRQMSAKAFINEALQRGIHPKQIRLKLQDAGIHWPYSFTAYDGERRLAHQGRRERARRLKQVSICERCSEPIAADRTLRTCDSCLSTTSLIETV